MTISEPYAVCSGWPSFKKETNPGRRVVRQSGRGEAGDPIHYNEKSGKSEKHFGLFW